MADKHHCGDSDTAPRRPENRAGLEQIDYRITMQPESLKRMTWQLPRQAVYDPAKKEQVYPLRGLRSRDLSDPTISLIDAWALASDVLAFYSERIANEGYIGTATQRRSVLELARMIGYELSPGVAASAHLAFTVENADDPYRKVVVGAGVQAMSIPAKKGELPQIFETVEEITARAEWNNIHARTERPQHLVLFYNNSAEDERNGTLYLFDLDGSFDTEDIANSDPVTITTEDALRHYHPLSHEINLAQALRDRIEDSDQDNDIEPELLAIPVNEVCLSGLGLNLRSGTRMLAVAQQSEGAITALPFRVVSANEDAAFRLTRVILSVSGKAPTKVRRAPLYRIPRLLPGLLPTNKLALDRAQLDTHVRGKRWSGDGLSAFVRSQNWQRAQLMTLVAKILLPAVKEQDYDTPLGLFAMRDQAGFFGNTAPLWATLDYGKASKGPYANSNWDGNSSGQTPTPPYTIWQNGVGSLYGGAAQAYLDREVSSVQPNSWAILESASGKTLGLQVTHAAPESRADFAITGKSTGVSFETAAGEALQLGGDQSETIYNNFRFRSTQIYAASQLMPLAGVPLSRELQAKATSIELDRLYLDLERGRPVSISGNRLDAESINGRETQIIAEVQHIDGVTRLLFNGKTAYPYDRTTVRINANVAQVTHGEAFKEQLGSGDARQVHQRFTLSKPPLTYVAAANAEGRTSTLEIRVDGILWNEIPALGSAGPEDAVYEVRLSDDGKTHIRFGDGVTGRRLPTGELNITAKYRSGIGTGGEVAEEAISQLKTKPLGTRSVVNPSPATGSEDRESLRNAKKNAPAAVKTLGRIVSLTDYEEFAINFAGIGEAQVRQLWSGQNKVIHLTVTAEQESVLTESDTLIINLKSAIDSVRDPSRPVIVQPYTPQQFTVTAHLQIDRSYLTADVKLAARTVIEERFGYNARALAQSVTAAEVISALHTVAGVVSVDLNSLAIINDGERVMPTTTRPEEVLPASAAIGLGQRGQRNTFEPAELLTVLPSAIIFTTQEAADA